MKKKLFSLLTALVLCLLCAVPAFAEMPLVMDTYELFKPEVTAELEQKAQDASAGHGVNVYLLTVSDIGGQNVREFAKDWYAAMTLLRRGQKRYPVPDCAGFPRLCYHHLRRRRDRLYRLPHRPDRR